MPSMTDKEIYEARRASLVALATKFTSLRALAEASETDPAHLSQIKNRTRTMGEAVARRMEHQLGLPVGCMDGPGLVKAIERGRADDPLVDAIVSVAKEGKPIVDLSPEEATLIRLYRQSNKGGRNFIMQAATASAATAASATPSKKKTETL